MIPLDGYCATCRARIDSLDRDATPGRVCPTCAGPLVDATPLRLPNKQRRRAEKESKRRAFNVARAARGWKPEGGSPITRRSRKTGGPVTYPCSTVNWTFEHDLLKARLLGEDDGSQRAEVEAQRKAKRGRNAQKGQVPS